MYRIIPRLWAIVFCIVIGIGAFRFNPACIHTDIRALLPASEETASAEKILAHSTETSRDIWVLIGMPTLELAADAANLFSTSSQNNGLKITSPAEAFDPASLAKALAPYRNILLTDSDKTFLTTATDAQLLRRSLSLLYQPLSISLLPFQDDPLGTFENILRQQADSSRLRFTGPCVSLRKDLNGVHYCVLTARSHQAMSAAGSMPVTKALNQARKTVLQVYPSAQIHAAGVPLISEDAAANAASESSFIGTISVVAIVLLVAVFFASLTPLFITLSVLAVSVLFACSAVIAIFGEVHVLTIVFGATLLGICVDYVFHLLCAVSIGLSGIEARAKLFKPLTLSFITTSISYLVMIISPMPGLQQMAVFCITGLLAAYLNVLFVASRLLKPGVFSKPAQRFALLLSRLPCLEGRTKTLFIALVLFVSCIGCLQLKTQNELSLLNRVPPSLLDDMQFIAKELSPMSPGQVFVVSAPDTETVLQTAKTLHNKLEALAEKGIISPSIDPTVFLPSRQEQREANALSTHAFARALQLTSQNLGMELPSPSTVSLQPLTLSTFQSLSIDSLNRFWLSDTALLIPLAGVSAESLPHLKNIADSIKGVRFVNTTAEIADNLAQYRNNVFFALISALIIISLILAVSIRKQFLHFCLPSLLSIALILGMCGLIDIPFSLFTVLPLVLVIGLGLDYAIVLYSETNSLAAHNSVFLAAVSTLCAFGLLAFSSTPALHWFGLTLSMAIGTVVFVTFALRPAHPIE